MEKERIKFMLLGKQVAEQGRTLLETTLGTFHVNWQRGSRLVVGNNYSADKPFGMDNGRVLYSRGELEDIVEEPR